MCEEKLELDETLFWENDPPQNEDEEPEEGASTEDSEDDDDDDLLAPTGDGDIKPPGTIGGGG